MGVGVNAGYVCICGQTSIFCFYPGQDKHLCFYISGWLRCTNLKRDLVNWDELTRKPYFTVSEACLVLNVRVETLRRWIKEGIVKTNRVGKKHLISREILLNSRTHK